MKKIIALMLMTVIGVGMLVGCGNKQIFDLNQKFDYAVVSFPDGSVKKIELKKWTDYEDGDQLQLIAKDGTVYLVHATNCVLVNED